MRPRTSIGPRSACLERAPAPDTGGRPGPRLTVPRRWADTPRGRSCVRRAAAIATAPWPVLPISRARDHTKEVRTATGPVRLPPPEGPGGSTAAAGGARGGREGPRGRTEPDPDDEAPVRIAGTPDRREPDRGSRRHRGTRRDLEDRRARPPQPARGLRRRRRPVSDDRRGGAADRRPPRAQPRHDRWLALPRRSLRRPRLGDARARRERGAEELRRRAGGPDRRLPGRHVPDLDRAERAPDRDPRSGSRRAFWRHLPEARAQGR